MRSFLPPLLGIALLAGAVAAHDYRAGDLTIEHPWTRATPAGATVAAGYMVIHNSGSDPDRLIAGTAPFAGRVEIHEMVMDGDVMRMREVDGGLEIPPGGAIVLEPGGYHVMFLDLREPLVEGGVRDGTLTFEQADEIAVHYAIESMAAEEPGHALDP